MKSGLLTALLVLALVVPMAAHGAAPEDPYYKQWARFKVGSSVTLTGTAEDSSGVSNFTQTITLKELKGDELTIEISRKEGEKSITKSKKVEKLASKTDKIINGGQEEITLAGEKYKCHRYTFKIFDDKGKEMMTFEYWFHPDIPGAAKIVSRSSYGADAGMGNSKASQAAVSWIKK